MITFGELLERFLVARRIDTVYGAPALGIDVVPVTSPSVAQLLAAAHERVHGTAAAILTADARLVLGGGSDTNVLIDEATDLLDVPAGPVTLAVRVDPTMPAPDVVPEAPPTLDRWVEPPTDALERLVAATSPVVLAGPGVISAGAVADLNAFATGGNVGVLNTWGAKGVFHWRSRHHWATVGLQADDFRLGGIEQADLVVATGVDADEAPRERWSLAPVLTLPAGALGALSEAWRRPFSDLGIPPLRNGLAAVTQDGWTQSGPPLPPSRVTLHYSQALGPGGVVAADAGLGGYWVARTFATRDVGAAHVPGRRLPGFGVACAVVARLRQPRRPVLVVVDDVAAPVADVIEAARSLGVAVPIEVWDATGPTLDSDQHLARLEELIVSEDPKPVALATDASQLERMVGVAGLVTAWGGLR